MPRWGEQLVKRDYSVALAVDVLDHARQGLRLMQTTDMHEDDLARCEQKCQHEPTEAYSRAWRPTCAHPHGGPASHSCSAALALSGSIPSLALLDIRRGTYVRTVPRRRHDEDRHPVRRDHLGRDIVER